jgi:hypothetical protein
VKKRERETYVASGEGVVCGGVGEGEGVAVNETQPFEALVLLSLGRALLLQPERLAVLRQGHVVQCDVGQQPGAGKGKQKKKWKQLIAINKILPQKIKG